MMTASRVRRIGTSSRDRFDHFVARREPVVVEKSLRDSPIACWSLAELGRSAGRHAVSSYTRLDDDPFDASRRAVTMVAADTYAREATRSPGAVVGSSVRLVLDEAFPGLSAELAPRGFVDSSRLLFAELFSGIDYSTAGHCHPKAHAFLCHVEGSKDVVLYPPDDVRLLYAHPVYTEEFSTSRVDFFSPRSTLFPLFVEGRRLVARLEPGDALFIPVGYWHAVRAVGTSTSMSFFWQARAREQTSFRAAARNHLGWAISRAVEASAASIVAWPSFARAVMRRYHPTSVDGVALGRPSDATADGRRLR
jgi:hypothetical protein